MALDYKADYFNITAAATQDVQPASGDSWVITGYHVQQSAWGGTAAIGCPDGKYGVYDGTDQAWWSQITAWYFYAGRWAHPIDNADRLRLTNNDGGNRTFGYFGRVAAIAAGIAESTTNIVSASAAANVDAQPASGDEWVLKGYASDQWDATASVDERSPDMLVQMYDGTLASNYTYDLGPRLRNLVRGGGHFLFFDNTDRLRFNNTSASTAKMAHLTMKTKD